MQRGLGGVLRSVQHDDTQASWAQANAIRTAVVEGCTAPAQRSLLTILTFGTDCRSDVCKERTLPRVYRTRLAVRCAVPPRARNPPAYSCTVLVRRLTDGDARTS